MDPKAFDSLARYIAEQQVRMSARRQHQSELSAAILCICCRKDAAFQRFMAKLVPA